MNFSNLRAHLLPIAIAAVLLASSAKAQVITADTVAASRASGVDVVELIQNETAKVRPKLGLGKAASVEVMDMNTAFVSGTGGSYIPINQLSDPAERSICQDGAQLLLNSQLISGATLLSAAQSQRGEAASPTLRSLTNFAVGMTPRLTPAEVASGIYEDNTPLHDRTDAARAALADLRGPLQLFAQMHVFGQIWNDPVATAAGSLGLKLARATAEEMAQIQTALPAPVAASKAPSWAPAAVRDHLEQGPATIPVAAAVQSADPSLRTP